MFARLRHLSLNARPAGYVPGAVLARLRHDLAGIRCERLDDVSMKCTVADGALTFEAREQVESQFLMYLVTTELTCELAPACPFEGELTLSHRGLLTRSGVQCTAGRNADAAARALAQRLTNDAGLSAALLPLDFQTCRLRATPRGCEARLVHFGASEVVYRFPALRRYITLAPAQLQAMLAGFATLRRLMGG